jgi:spore germination cell wall hydrolase CwlJ-like protein
MTIKRNIAGITAMLAAAAIAAAAGHLGPAGGEWRAEAAGAATTSHENLEGTPYPTAGTPDKAAEAANLSALVAQFEDRSGNYYDDKGFSSNRYEYTDAELTALATVIHLEARNQPYECMIAVGNVVMNRVLSPGYPGENIIEVVSAPNQFCYDPDVTPMKKCVDAARDILDYQVWTVPQDTYFFRANKSTSDWYKHVYYRHWGNTAFYRNRYAGRSDGDAVPPRLFERKYRWPQYGCAPGERVVKLQTMLSSLGYAVKADGYFGKSTEKAVMDFQKAEGLKQDGIAGPETLGALIRKRGAIQAD